MRWAAVVLTLAALTACSDPPHSGDVIGKHYEPESQYMTMQCYSYNSDGTCAMNIPTWHTDPAAWMLHIRSDVDPDHTGWVHVDQQTYGEYRVGQHYPDAR